MKKTSMLWKKLDYIHRKVRLYFILILAGMYFPHETNVGLNECRNNPCQIFVSFWNRALFVVSIVRQHAWYFVWARAYEPMSHSIPAVSALDVVDNWSFWNFRTVTVSPCMFNCIIDGVGNDLHMIFLGLSKSPDDLRDSSMLGIGPLKHIKNICYKGWWVVVLHWCSKHFLNHFIFMAPRFGMFSLLDLSNN